MVKKATLVAVAVAVIASPFAFAAVLGLASGSLGSGTAPVSSCDSAFTVTYTTSGGNVTAATVGDIADPDCEGGDLSLTLVNSVGDSIASGGPATIPTDGDATPNSLAVSVSPNPAAGTVAGVRIAIAGP